MAKQKVELETTRRSAPQILEQVKNNGREELARSSKALAFSGVAGGLTMGLTGLSVAITQSILRPNGSSEFVSHLMYPMGFIAVIIGRAQLFTENTLYPVILVLDEHRHVRNMLRLWAIVFISNVAGAFLFALLAVRTSSLMPEYAEALIKLGADALAQSTPHIFWSGVIGGWIIALVAWMVSASHWTIGQIAIVWMATFLVGLGHFAHCIATSGEILAAVCAGRASVGAYAHWIVFATLGNIVGGVMIVSLLNYGQVKAGEPE
ncbi:MAG TPA: formate/nitrite transporter family protein [Terriglobales bacterium]|nr:formate/nitrite transporter family protein [Terriglobales bacterium]